MPNVIEVRNLTKKYNSLTAVNNISFEVKRGEVFGLLGENGAGKTTTLEMIEGLRKPTQGSIKVLGLDIRKNLAEIKQKIGVQLQSSAYYNFLRLSEIMDLFGNFYQKQNHYDELFQLVGLENKKNAYIHSLSGGQKQRFSIIASLINNPQIVFLDEPTTGLDPVARRNTWEIIAKIKKQGKTIILTTHYMEEAEILADRVAIMEKGKIIVLDQPHFLVEHAKHPYKIEFILTNDNPQIIERLKKNCHIADQDIMKLPGKNIHYETHFTSQQNLNRAIGLLQKENPESLTVGHATLEDVFIELTGKKIEDENEQEG